MIKASHIYKSFGHLKVLHDVSIEVSKGEIVSIVGSSGAGKTTLLQILGTLDKADPHPKTQIEIGGENLMLISDKKLSLFRNEKIGFIFQFHQLLPEFTALENICLPALIKKVPHKQAKQRAYNLLEFLSLTNRANHYPSQLSGGEQQRIAIARALINQPDVIFADEPSGNLDSENAALLHNLFIQLREEFNQTFVIVTHNKELADLSDRKFTMKDGQIIR